MKPLPTLRQLRYLATLAETRHFGRAAEQCLVTQSTLSAGIQELETLLGARLVERTKRRVDVTPLGDAVVERAREVLSRAEDIVDLVQAAGAPLTGDLRLGVIPTIGPFLLPRVLPRLREAYPELRLFLREEQTHRVLAGLHEGHLDLGLIALPWETGGLESMELFADPFVLAAPPEHPLAAGAATPLSDLADEDLLLLEEGNCLRDHALAACSLPSARRAEGFQATSLATLVQMVANGLGVSLLPRMALEAGILEGTGIAARELDGDMPARIIGLVWRRSSCRKEDFRLFGEFLQSSQ